MKKRLTPAVGSAVALLLSSCICHAKVLYHAEKRVNTNRDRHRSFSWSSDPVRKDAWTDWVFHIQWDYRTNGHGGGRVEVWQQVDGTGYKKVVDYTGPIGYNDERGVYLKWGIYKFPWKSGRGSQSPRIFYYDEVKVGDARSSFEDMRVAGPRGER